MGPHHRGGRRGGEVVMEPRELVVISGKGGTGKTSVVAAFAALAGGAVLADCDVDAADLHLVLQPEVGEPHEFSGRSTAVVDADACTACGRCAEVCRFDAISRAPGGEYAVDTIACEGCELCKRVCPADAVRMEPVVNGAWMVSRDPLRTARPRPPRRGRRQLGQAGHARPRPGQSGRGARGTPSDHRRRFAGHRLPRDRLAHRSRPRAGRHRADRVGTVTTSRGCCRSCGSSGCRSQCS